ncbi:MAG: aspartyl/glutamyl-tRNA amidotransferase subunit A [Bacilli bacterium]|nr:aspartyl/glutamyl-tRNA amidotransferase subunit A [Bacilli bacterium]
MSKEWITKSVTEIAPLIENKDISPVELTKAVLDHAEKNDEKINAYISFRREKALEDAKKAEQEIINGNYRGIYHGIPMGIKDNIYIKGEVTTMASKIHRDFVPSYNATVIDKLNEAGAIIIGKLNMHEYAWGATTNNPHYGPCRNPWDLEYIPGGSSGGSGAALIAHTTMATLGTDTGGSVRIPAATNGIVGLKQTYGRVSNYGSFPLAWTLDHIGPMTKTVKDAAALLEVIAGYDPKDSTTVNVPVDQYLDVITGDVKDLVIGINEEYFFNNVDKDIEQAVRNKIRQLEKEGARIQEVDIPSLQFSEWAVMTTIISEPAAIHQQNHLNRPEDFGEDLQFLFDLGELPSAVDYIHAQQIRRHLKQDFQNVFENIDVLITPTLPIQTPKIGADTVELNGEEVGVLDHIIRFTGPFNITGLPALSVPCGFKGHLPIGIQIVGKPFDEKTILNVGYAIEQMNPLQGRIPDTITF